MRHQAVLWLFLQHQMCIYMMHGGFRGWDFLVV
jgi:hypothetical protein